MVLLRRSYVVLRKDLLLQWRTRSRFVATLVFGVTTLLLFSFAGLHTQLAEQAPGYLWLALTLASTLSLAESLRIEVHNGALDAIRLLPADPRALFYGKAVANFLVLVALGALLCPFMAALYDTPLRLPLAGVVVLGAAGLAAPGTLYATLAARARSSDVLLPLLLFPLLIPALVAATRATSFVLAGDPMQQLGGWVGLLAAFDVVYWSLCGVLYRYVVED